MKAGVQKAPGCEEGIISVSEYRKLLNDYATSDERIRERVAYIALFCRRIVRSDLEKYVGGKK